MEYTSFEDTMRRHELRIRWWELQSLEMKCFYLERRLGRLELRWRQPSPLDDPHRLRIERMRVRHEFEMLKIDVDAFERRVRPLLEGQT